MVESDLDIFSQVGTRIWRALTDASLSTLPDLVRVGNRTNTVLDALAMQSLGIEGTGSTKIKDNMMVADLPELVLAQGAFGAKVKSKSDVFPDISQDYMLIVTTDQLSYLSVNRIKHQTIKALLALGDQLGTYGSETYPPLCWVIGWDINGSDMMNADDLLQPQTDGSRRGSLRVKSLLTISVQMEATADNF